VILHEGAGGCAVVRDSYFASMSGVMAGPVLILNKDTINVSDCSFRDCNATDAAARGGACCLGADAVEIRRCCGLQCGSNDTGQYLFLAYDNFYAESAVSEVTMVKCGGANCPSGTIYVGEYVGIGIRDVNVTECAVTLNGAAMFVYGGRQKSLLVQFFLAERCDMAASILSNARSLNMQTFLKTHPRAMSCMEMAAQRPFGIAFL
jgi:hypothetical protein